MPRRREIPKREILPDPKHKSEEVAKFMNVLMTRGKKSVAERILYGALDTIAKKSGKDAFEVFNAAINNVKPMVEVRSRCVGGATLQVPHEVKKSRQQSLAIRWLVDAARSKRGKPMAKSLAEEFFDAFNNQGAAVTKKENVHKMADANKAFAHYRW